MYFVGRDFRFKGGFQQEKVQPAAGGPVVADAPLPVALAPDEPEQLWIC
jgi:hypothetical protein